MPVMRAAQSQMPTVTEHRLLQTKRNLDIEREMHDKTLATLAIASDKLVKAERLLDALDEAFEVLTGMTPAEFLEKG